MSHVLWTARFQLPTANTPSPARVALDGAWMTCDLVCRNRTQVIRTTARKEVWHTNGTWGAELNTYPADLNALSLSTVSILLPPFIGNFLHPLPHRNVLFGSFLLLLLYLRPVFHSAQVISSQSSFLDLPTEVCESTCPILVPRAQCSPSWLAL